MIVLIISSAQAYANKARLADQLGTSLHEITVLYHPIKDPLPIYDPPVQFHLNPECLVGIDKGTADKERLINPFPHPLPGSPEHAKIITRFNVAYESIQQEVGEAQMTATIETHPRVNWIFLPRGFLVGIHDLSILQGRQEITTVAEDLLKNIYPSIFRYSWGQGFVEILPVELSHSTNPQFIRKGLIVFEDPSGHIKKNLDYYISSFLWLKAMKNTEDKEVARFAQVMSESLLTKKVTDEWLQRHKH